MKNSRFVVAPLIAVALGAQTQVSNAAGTANISAPPPTAWTTVSRDANSAVWEQTTYELSPAGKAVPHVHHYTQLTTGLNVWRNGWVPATPEIVPLPDGTGAATNLASPIFFPSDIGSDVIRLTTPGGVVLQSGPALLEFDDGTNLVVLGVVTNSVGELISSNQVLYPDIFRGSGFRADLLCTVRLSGSENDLVLRTSIPDPVSLGLGANARLQLLTEWFNTPEPEQTTSAASTVDGLTDTTLRWGSTTVGRGRAFVVDPVNSPPSTVNASTPVLKSWVHLNGRAFLAESVPYGRIAPQLAQLPTAGSPRNINRNLASGNSIFRKVSAKEWQPPVGPVKTAISNKKSKITRQLARAEVRREPGVVLDYVTINTDTNNFTFQGDTTYCVSAGVNLGGTTTIEGGAVIKVSDSLDPSTYYYDPSGGTGNAVLSCGTINCQTGPYRPAVFTSMDDNSVGESISGSSGSPSTLSVPFLNEANSSSATFEGVRFCYAGVAVFGSGFDTLSFRDCQFVACGIGVGGYGNIIALQNCLVAGETGIQDPEGDEIALENVTMANWNYNVDIPATDSSLWQPPWGSTLDVTNSLFTGGQSLSSVESAIISHSGTVNDAANADVSAGGFQTVGAGSYYLTNNSPYRNIGTTNIDPAVLADLAIKTTYPPIVYSNAVISSSSFSPQAQRDTDAPDLGYHYDPLDYCCGGVSTTTNLTFTAGTSIGWFELPGSGGPGYGIGLTNYQVVTFSGTVSEPCVFARYSNVQEGGNANWTTKGWLGGIVANGSHGSDINIASRVNAEFTHFAGLSTGPNNVRDYVSDFILCANNCEFWSGSDGGYGMSFDLTNCLMDRLPFGAQAATSGDSAIGIRNCTMHGGSIGTTHWSGSTWPTWMENCAFDATTFSMDDPSGGNTNITYCDFNAFLTNAQRTIVQGTHDITNVTSFNWQTSWLGNYYLPPDGPLIDQGSTTADQIGLYHFTTQTNQVKETNSVVDIGYHYVAVDGNGNPIDTNGDGIPDYLEDANGNGLVDSGEIGWNIVSDLGLKVLITRPRNGSILP